MMRLISANNLTSAGLIAHLRQRRAEVAAHDAALRQVVRKSGVEANVRRGLDK